METPNLPARRQPAVMPDKPRDIDTDTIEPFGDSAWFAWRKRARSIDIRNGVWWTDDGTRVVSLAMGSDLHAHGFVDWELYAFKGAADGMAYDICCHESRSDAERCALTFLTLGRYCTEPPADVIDV